MPVANLTDTPPLPPVATGHPRPGAETLPQTAPSGDAPTRGRPLAYWQPGEPGGQAVTTTPRRRRRDGESDATIPRRAAPGRPDAPVGPAGLEAPAGDDGGGAGVRGHH